MILERLPLRHYNMANIKDRIVIYHILYYARREFFNLLHGAVAAENSGFLLTYIVRGNIAHLPILTYITTEVPVFVFLYFYLDFTAKHASQGRFQSSKK